MSTAPYDDQIDLSELQGIMIRWKLVEQYLLGRTEAVLEGKMALHVLISHDVPTLLSALKRLRPDFDHSETSPDHANAPSGTAISRH